MEQYYGRSTDGHEPFQNLIDHLTETAELTSQFCSSFTCPEIGRVCGMLHDIGKYSNEFQRRVRGDKIQTDHATAGAKTAADLAEKEVNLSKLAYYLMSYVIAGHHAGLPDMGNANTDGATLYQRLQNCIPDYYSAWKTEVPDSFPDLTDFQNGCKYPTREEASFSLFLYTHFLFSCLVDADRTSAQNFSNPLPKQNYPSLTELNKTLNTYLSTAFQDKTGELNVIRNGVLEKCKQAAERDCGMFTLTVPTGGGKTLSSLAFALNHAVHNSMSGRIIYTIPFTSIIEQNAGVYKKIFGAENILEHHSHFIIPKSQNLNSDDPENENQKLAMAVSNWDVPLIMTTNVQFFESLFSAHPSRSRKVHNIANSVIILDEVQALPNELLRPCMFALAELVKKYHCSVVLCTATQPDFKENGILPDIPVTDIIPDYAVLFEQLKRAACRFDGIKSLQETADEIVLEKQCLCIVNSKKHARDLYDCIKTKGDCFHLSTSMYPEHRKQVIETIRQRLKDGQPCRVVSTQLIEAGVDIDFPVVYRSITGVDSIQQAAGRCNREGKLSSGTVIVFQPAEEGYGGPDYLKQTARIAATLSDKDYLSLETVKQYFHELYAIRTTKMDKPDILSLCKTAMNTLPPVYPFRKISDDFKMIADSGYAVIIPKDPACRKLLDQLCEYNVAFVQSQITPYCVTVRKKELDRLYDSGQVQLFKETFTVLCDPAGYDEAVGLVIRETEQDYVY